MLDVLAIRANGDHFRYWETRFHDYGLLEGYRDPSKSRETETDAHYITAKRPFKIAVLRTAIPSSEWTTLDDVITPKILTGYQGKPWVWLKKIKEHYVGASTLPFYHFWVKMIQTTTAPITTWETMVRTSAGRCSFGTQADMNLCVTNLSLASTNRSAASGRTFSIEMGKESQISHHSLFPS